MDKTPTPRRRESDAGEAIAGPPLRPNNLKVATIVCYAAVERLAAGRRLAPASGQAVAGRQRPVGRGDFEEDEQPRASVAMYCPCTNVMNGEFTWPPGQRRSKADA